MHWYRQLLRACVGAISGIVQMVKGVDVIHAKSTYMYMTYMYIYILRTCTCTYVRQPFWSVAGTTANVS